LTYIWPLIVSIFIQIVLVGTLNRFSRKSAFRSFKVICCLHGTAPPYLSADLLRLSDVVPRQRLRSATISALVGRRTQRSTIGDRAVAAAAPAVWNSLPEDVQPMSAIHIAAAVPTSVHRSSLSFFGVLWAQDTLRDFYLAVT